VYAEFPNAIRPNKDMFNTDYIHKLCE